MAASLISNKPGEGKGREGKGGEGSGGGAFSF